MPRVTTEELDFLRRVASGETGHPAEIVIMAKMLTYSAASAHMVTQGSGEESIPPEAIAPAGEDTSAPESITTATVPTEAPLRNVVITGSATGPNGEMIPVEVVQDAFGMHAVIEGHPIPFHDNGLLPAQQSHVSAKAQLSNLRIELLNSIATWRDGEWHYEQSQIGGVVADALNLIAQKIADILETL